MNYYIFQNSNDSRKKELKEQITNNLPNIVTDPIQADLIIVLWWDGTMLDAIHKLHNHNKPFFWVNCGTKWFLLNEINDIHQIPTEFDQIETITEPFIDIEVTNKTGKTYKAQAINDILISKGDRSERINISINDKHIFTWSGLLFSSPIWSTGTWINEWWAILPVGNNIIGVKWFSSKPFDRKIDNTRQKITTDIESRTPITTYIDGSHEEIPNTKNIVLQSSERLFTLWFTKLDNWSNFENKRMQLYAEKLWNIL